MSYVGFAREQQPATDVTKVTRVRGGILLTDQDERWSNVSVADIASLAAPVLWFSPDEPAVLDGYSLPAALPGDTGKRVVYWAASEQCLGCRFAIRYFFYYPVDYGLNAHLHDVESIQVLIDIDTVEGHDVLRVVRISGSAHGIGWYTNELRLGRDDEVVLPLHVIVEEGKHASAPDRNGDGIYNPGYDVSHYPKEAWGIRDTMRSRYLTGTSFAMHMYKVRQGSDRVWPPSVGSDEPQYTLRMATDVPGLCESGKAIFGIEFEDRRRLESLLNGKRFCGFLDTGWNPPTRGALPGLSLAYGKFMEDLSLEFGFEGPRWRASTLLGLARVPVVDGWVGIQMSLVEAGSNELGLFSTAVMDMSLLYTPSASRFVDWYVSAGTRLYKAGETVGGQALIEETQVVAIERLEFGFKFRFPTPESWLGGLFPSFIGVRTGLARTGDTTEVVVAIGSGAF